MKTHKSIIERLEIECLPEDYDQALDTIFKSSYTLQSKKRKNVFGQPVYFLVAEKQYQGGK